jgi:hypothetical protein
MKQLTDEEIQRLLEEGASIDGSQDVALYDKVFEVLSSAPDPLPNEISSNVVATIYYQTERKTNFKTRLAVSVTIVCGFIIFLLAAFEVNPGTMTWIAEGLFRYKWIILFLLIILPAVSLSSRKTRF